MKKTLNKRTKFIGFITSFIVIYAVFGFYFLPKIVKPQLIDLISEQTTLTVSIEQIDINPFTLSVAVDNFHAAKNNETFFSFKQLILNIKVIPLVKGIIAFDQISIVEPFSHIKLSTSGEINLQNLLKDSPTSPEEISQDDTESPWIISVVKFQLIEGQIAFEDHSIKTAFKQHYKDINITLENFSTKPDSFSNNVMKATTSRGTIIEWQGDLSLVPLSSKGKLSVAGDLQVVSDYLQDELLIKIQQGKLKFSSDYRFSYIQDIPSLQLNDTDITVSNLEIVQVDENKPVVGLSSFNMSIDEFDLIKKSIVINTIKSNNIKLISTKNKFSKFGIADLFVLEKLKKTENSAPSSHNTTPNKNIQPIQPVQPVQPVQVGTTDNWRISIKEIAPVDTQINIIDTAQEPYLTHRFDIPLFSLVDLQRMANKPATLKAKIIYNSQATIDVEGTVIPKEKQLDFDISTDKIKFNSFQHILNSVTHLAIDDGLLSSQFKLQIDATNDIPKILLTGDIQVNKFELHNKQLSDARAKLINLEALEIDGLSFYYPENTLTINAIRIKEPYLNFDLNKDVSSNFDHLIKQKINIEQTLKNRVPVLNQVEKYEKNAAPLNFTIKRFSISDANLHFRDQSVTPVFEATLGDLSGRIKAISSVPDNIADIKFKGLIDKSAPISITGTLKPLQHKDFTDIHVNIKDISLPSLSPYSSKYAGYKLAKGLLHIKQHHQLENSHLSSTNSLIIESIELGESVESESATSLPVGLAISLLKDGKGNIELDLPMSGDLDNPDFRYSSVVLGALGSVITSTVSSPFNVLGNLIGVNSNNLDYVKFTANSSVIIETQQVKLNSLAKALILKPNFILKIQGVGSNAIDRDEIAYAKLLTQLSIPVKSLHKNLSREEQVTVLDHYQSLPGSPSSENVSLEDALQSMLKQIVVENDDLLALGNKRSLAIEQYLINNTEVKKESIVLLDSSTETDKNNLDIDNEQIKIIFSLHAK